MSMDDVINSDVSTPEASIEQNTEQQDNELEATQQQEQTQTQAQTKNNKQTTQQQQNLSKQDKQELDAVAELIKSQDLPEEVRYFKGKDGKLTFVVPIDGVNYQVPFKELVKGFNLNQAGYKRLEEAKATQKYFNDFLERGKQDPSEILNLLDRLGHDKYAIAERLLEEKIKESQMSDDEREASKLRRELEQIKKEREEEKTAREKEIKSRTIKEQSTKLQNEYAEQLKSAMAQHGFDTKSFDTKKGIANQATKKVYEAAAKGIELSFNDAVFQVKQEWQKQVWDVFGDLDENHIADVIPQKLIDAILKASLNKKPVTPTGKSSIGSQVNLNPAETATKRKQKMSTSDYFRKI